MSRTCRYNIKSNKNNKKRKHQRILEFSVSKKYKKLLIEKASILINGVSLTISKITKKDLKFG